MAECPKCAETVYAADRVVVEAPESLAGEWHKACLVCASCGCKLNPNIPGLLHEKSGQPWCNRCVKKPGAAAAAPAAAAASSPKAAAQPPVWAAAAAGGIGKPVAPSPEIDDDDAAAAATPPPVAAPSPPPAPSPPKPASPPPPPPPQAADPSAGSAKDIAAKFRALETAAAAPASPKSATKDIAAKFRALEAGGAPVPRPAAPAAPKPAAPPAPAPAPKKAAPVLGGAPPCPRCSKAVYAAEKVLGPGGDWHRACLRCATCGRGIAAAAWSEHKGEAYCKACHEKEFGPKGVRGGAGGGMMHAA